MPLPSSPSDPVEARPIWWESAFREGVLDMLPATAGLAAWGLVTGVAMIQVGMPWPQVLLMSLVVFAGTAQLTTAPLIAAGAPLWVIWATALCVNLRFVVFSASWRPYLVHGTFWQRVRAGYFTTDLNYVLFMKRFPQPQPGVAQTAYFWGGALTNWVGWHVASLLGMVLASRFPVEWGVGFAGTLTLVALASLMISHRGTVLAAVVAGSASVAAYALPLKLHIVVAIAAAVATGVVWDKVGLGPAGAPSNEAGQ